MRTRRNEQIEVANVNHPGSIRRVDAHLYQAMKQAYLKTLAAAPGALSLAQIGIDVQRHLPQALFPGGAKSGWWTKLVQLDLEAKGIVARGPRSPVRIRLGRS